MTGAVGVAAAGGGLAVQGAMASHVGCVRSGNEDRVLYVIPAAGERRRGVLALVADGMGGHAAGEVASRIAAEEIERVYRTTEASPPALLAAAFAAANRAIFAHAAADAGCRGMGTTCTAALILDDQLYLGHVGDSRAYLLRDRRLHPLSEDDSLVNELVRAGEISREEAKRRPDRNVILRALGTRPEIVPAIWRDGLALAAGDRLLLCSDGLTDLVDEDTIGRLAGEGDPGRAVARLTEAALAAGGLDNVSVGVFAIGEAAAPAAGDDQPTRPIRLPAADAGGGGR